MKLQVKFVGMGRDRALMLCDETGTPLPDQSSVTVRQDSNAVATVTVEFLIGNNVRMGAPD